MFLFPEKYICIQDYWKAFLLHHEHCVCRVLSLSAFYILYYGYYYDQIAEWIIYSEAATGGVL